jgi:hypothetical protein
MSEHLDPTTSSTASSGSSGATVPQPRSAMGVTTPIFEATLSRLAALGDPERPEVRVNELERWWIADALHEYADHGWLTELELGLFREVTWTMLVHSARMIEWAHNAVPGNLGSAAILRAIALIGSPARGEASIESDADWNALLNEYELLLPTGTGSGPRLIAPGIGEAYCLSLAERDLEVHRLLEFPALIGAMAAQGYVPSPPRPDGSPRERLRVFAGRELLEPFDAAARAGLAAPVLSSSAGIAAGNSDATAWERMRRQVSRSVQPKLVALARLCHVGRTLHSTSFLGADNLKAVRHATHGVMSSVCQALLIFQTNQPEVIAPYWRAPLLLSGYPERLTSAIGRAAFQVALSRVRPEFTDAAVLGIVNNATDKALDVAGPRDQGWLTQVELDLARRALRSGRHPDAACQRYCL